MTAQCLVDILLRNTISIYIVNLTARTIISAKFVTVVYASKAQTGIVNARDEEQDMLKDECPILRQCDKFNSNLNVNTVSNKSPEHSDPKSDTHSTVRHSDEISKTDWQ